MTITDTHQSSPHKGLTIEQLNAIDLLVQGKSDREVAEAVGVARETVTRWRNENPIFAEELFHQRKVMWGEQSRRLKDLADKAISVLGEDLESDDTRLRQNAAIHVLKAVGVYGTPEDAELEGPSPPNPKEMTMQELIEYLERELNVKVTDRGN